MSKYNLVDIYEQYKIGSGWTRDFDYDGMLKAGLKTGVDTDIEVLKKIVEDFTDVNYHREADHLYKAIEALEDGATKEASMFFGDFHAEIKNTIKDQGMDIEPTVGKFMASKMEEGEEIKEVTLREGSRIEGDLNIKLKAKFLDAFEDLYFDLVEEDPYFAEDVVDHLANEMLKHLDAIQAQGDKLAGVNEAVFGPVEFLKSKGIDEEAIAEFMKMHSKDIVGASEEEIADEFVNFATVNPEYLNDAVEDLKYGDELREHFNRFK